MSANIADLTADQIAKLAQGEKQSGNKAKAKLSQAHKSAQDLAKAASAVTALSKKNPEL